MIETVTLGSAEVYFSHPRAARPGDYNYPGGRHAGEVRTAGLGGLQAPQSHKIAALRALAAKTRSDRKAGKLSRVAYTAIRSALRGQGVWTETTWR